MSYGSQSLCRAEYDAIQLAVHARASCPSPRPATSSTQGNPLEFPASLPHVLTVAAVNARRTPPSSPTRTPPSTSSRPGESIITAVPVALDTEDGTQDGYELLDGTSFSAPMVAARGRLGPRRRGRTSRPTRSPRSSACRRATSAARATTRRPASALLDVGAALAKAPPPRDPLEPNDDIGLGRRPRVRQRRAADLHAAAGPRAWSALLDVYEDPADVYRVRVRGRSRVRVTVKPAFGNPTSPASHRHEGLATCRRGRASRRRGSRRSRRTGKHTERITLRNRSRRTRTLLRRASAPSPAGRSARRGLPPHDPALSAAAGAHCASARSPLPSSAAGVGTAGCRAGTTRRPARPDSRSRRR